MSILPVPPGNRRPPRPWTRLGRHTDSDGDGLLRASDRARARLRIALRAGAVLCLLLATAVAWAVYGDRQRSSAARAASLHQVTAVTLARAPQAPVES
jgi:hypothetical protein